MFICSGHLGSGFLSILTLLTFEMYLLSFFLTTDSKHLKSGRGLCPSQFFFLLCSHHLQLCRLHVEPNNAPIKRPCSIFLWVLLKLCTLLCVSLFQTLPISFSLTQSFVSKLSAWFVPCTHFCLFERKSSGIFVLPNYICTLSRSVFNHSQIKTLILELPDSHQPRTRPLF